MCHPELFPEFADKNQNIEPLPINKKNQIKTIKKENKQEEITRVELSQNQLSQNRDTSKLGELIKNLSKNYENNSPDNYASRYQVEHITEEIKQIGLQYFVPNFQASEKRELFLEKQGYELARLETADNEDYEYKKGDYVKYPVYFENFEDMTYKNIDKSTLQRYIQNQKIETNEHEQTKNIDLKSLLKDMQQNDMLSRHIDTRTIPFNANYDYGFDLTSNLPNFQTIREIESLNDLRQKYFYSMLEEFKEVTGNDLEYDNYIELRSAIQNGLVDTKISDDFERYTAATNQITEEIDNLKAKTNNNFGNNRNIAQDFKNSVLDMIRAKKLQRANANTKAKIRNRRIQQNI